MKRNSAPDEPKIWIYSLLLNLANAYPCKILKAPFSYVFIELAPEIPVSLRNSSVGYTGRRVGLAAALATFIFCFCIPAIWTLSEGTFSGSDAGRLYFSDDTVNLILYTLICPLYVGLGVWLWLVSIHSSGELKLYSQSIQGEASPPRQGLLFREFLLFVLLLAISLLGTASYISDISDVSKVSVDYWFVDKTHFNERIIGPLGVYYFLLNFVLLFITLLTITFFMSIFSSAISIGSSLESYSQQRCLDFNVIRIKLEAFTEAYLLGKSITFCYMINILLWQSSALGNTDNLWIAGLFVTLIGVVFVSLPRYFIELQWFRYRQRTGQLVDHDRDNYQDIRPFNAKLIATALDTLLISGFALSFWPDYLISLVSDGEA
ncbi:hypothetical protein GCM10011369_07520 [Neiella marina]|uniref:Uncharacterized protein n=1 Tax=Neiella marina TaxID=508461 RepID=A0A8J2U2S8_9GAMM|nr:hypothetical protein [Neiella marina]GGA68367.1 hypothetical protein GCM10011369_07520 [Neiella marina]